MPGSISDVFLMQLLKTTLKIQSRDLAINSNIYAKTPNFLKDLTYKSYYLDQ